MAFIPVKQVGKFGVNRDLSTSELTMHWAERVVFGLSFAVRRIGILSSFKKSKVDLLAVDGNTGSPLLAKFVPVNAHQSTGAICLKRLVLMIFSVSAKAKVCKSVISRVAINVVDVLSRKFTMNVCPGKSVGLIFLVKNSDLNSASSQQLVVSAPDQTSLPVDLPSKKTSIWLVMKNLTKTLNVNAIFHAQFPLIENARVMVLGNRHGNQLSGATLAKQGAF